jgi:hypothetical protein
MLISHDLIRVTNRSPADDAPRPRFTLADVLAIIPKTKRSQIELLVRTHKITPAWPSSGTGHDRAFDGMNLFEIAVATELMTLGLVGQRLAGYFRQVVGVILDPRNARDAEYLPLLPSDDGALPGLLLSFAQLENFVNLCPGVYLLNVRRVVDNLEVALSEFMKKKGS